MSSKDELNTDLKIKGIFDNSHFPTLQTWVIYIVIALHLHFVMEDNITSDSKSYRKLSI